MITIKKSVYHMSYYDLTMAGSNHSITSRDVLSELASEEQLKRIKDGEELKFRLVEVEE
jgi:hypothetical protein